MAAPVALHIPDGFLSFGVNAVCWVLAALAVLYALRVADHDLDESRVPLLGVVAAFVFAAQMLNFRSRAARAGTSSGRRSPPSCWGRGSPA